jgi:outer membrane protein assembly factor BamB
MDTKKIIYRNVAVLSAIFIVAFSIMLITNYFQVRGGNTLEVEVMGILKELNDVNANNTALQEQIRQLDLLARKAYFIRHDRLMAGIYILLGMLTVLFLCVHGYFKGYKNIPDKEIDPVDDWLIKTKARQYVIYGASALVAVALLFAFLSSPYLNNLRTSKPSENIEIISDTGFEGFDDETIDEPETIDDEDIVDTEEPVEEVVTTTPSSSRTVNHNAFRGNNSNGTSTARNLPTTWNLSRGTNIAWKAEVPREGMSSPVINGNKVFITGADNDAREMYCYDLTNGQLLWRLAASDIPGSPATMPSLHYVKLASSTVATNGNQVAAIFASGDLICADMDGNRLWARNLGVPDNHYGYASSLITFGNLLIVQYDNRNNPRVMAFDMATGAERWSRPRTERNLNWGSPMIANINNVPKLILIGNPGITAYNPSNGQQLWRVEALSGEPGPSAVSANGIVFAAQEYSNLVAINGTDGTIMWSNNLYLPDTSSPIATADYVYVATDYGVFAAFDAQTGELQIEHELIDGFYSSPMIADGKIYLINRAGKVHVFTADKEFRLLEAFETGENTDATPAFTDGKIVIRTEKTLYAVKR